MYSLGLLQPPMGLKHGNDRARAVIIWPLEWKEYNNIHNFNNTQEQTDNFKNWRTSTI